MIDRLEAYRQAGVDLDLSNVASQIAADYSQQTWDNAGGMWHPVSPDLHLAASKVLPLDEIRKHVDTWGVGSVDGTGTKPEFYERYKNFYGLGSDLIAMAVDDLPIEGGEGVWVSNGLAISNLNDETIKYFHDLFRGLRDSANDADVVLWTGETAVHGDRLSGPTNFTVDWFGNAFGLVHKDRIITGRKIEVGDILYGFAEPESFRCNGISLARKAFKARYEENWHQEMYQGKTLGELVSVGSTVYAGLMKVLNGGYNYDNKARADVHGAAHISGGSLPEKIGRMLRVTGFGADITDPFEYPEIMRHCQEIARVKHGDSFRDMSDEEAITTWHGGQGYVVAAPEAAHDDIVSAGEEKGIEVKPIGHVTKNPGLRIVSKGVYRYGDVLELAA